jgi:hypothetical protein
MPQILLLVTAGLVLHHLSRVLLLPEQVVVGAVLKRKLRVLDKVVVATEPMEIVPLVLVLPILAAVEVVEDIQVVLVVLEAQAALVSLSSKSHLRTMPHSHLV